MRGEEVKITITSCECHAFDYVKLCSCLKANFDRFISSKIGYTKKSRYAFNKSYFCEGFMIKITFSKIFLAIRIKLFFLTLIFA